jgi:hypothetical protein
MIFLEPLMKSVLSVVIKMNVVLKRILQVIAGIVAVTLVAFLILLLVLTVTEYKPDTIEELSVNGQGGASVHAGDTLSVLTWNTGYGALGNNADFFMDGGSMVNTADEDRVQENMAAINLLKELEHLIRMLCSCRKLTVIPSVRTELMNWI